LKPHTEYATYSHVTIDFSSVDSLTIRSATAQGGKECPLSFSTHVVETAGAMWYGSQIADHESDEDTNAHLMNYVDYSCANQGYDVEMKIGFGNPKRIIPEIVNPV
jgi:manganese transport protein